MSHIRRYPSWQTLCLLLLYLCPAIAGSVLQARGLPEIVPPKPKVNEPEASIPGSGSAWKGGSLSEPEGYITSLDLSPADDVQEPLFSKPGTFYSDPLSLTYLNIHQRNIPNWQRMYLICSIP